MTRWVPVLCVLISLAVVVPLAVWVDRLGRKDETAPFEQSVHCKVRDAA